MGPDGAGGDALDRLALAWVRCRARVLPRRGLPGPLVLASSASSMFLEILDPTETID